MKKHLSRMNRNQVWGVLILGLTLLLSSGVIYALTLNSVTSSWSNAVGGSGAPTCLVTTTVGSEAQVRYGDDDFNAGCPADPNVQSGFGFSGNSTTSFTNGQPFVLGQLTHYNNPIFAGSLLESVDLNLNVDLGDPLYTAALTTTVTLDETANNLATCPYGGSQPCSDKVSINLQSTQFAVAGVSYQLEILGMIPGSIGSCTYNASQIKGSFISAENAANTACVFGRLTQIDDAQLIITKDANVTQAHPGDIIDYQIDYNCFSTTTSCNAPNIVDYLPDEVIYTGSTGSTHTIGSTGIYSSANNSVTFQFVDPLPAGSTGFVRIRVKVRNDGTVGNGQSINNLAVSTLGNGPTSTTTNSIPTIAASNWKVVKTAPPVVYLDTDRPTTDNVYSVGICSNGSDVNLQGAQMVDTLPANAVFVSASGGGVYIAGTPGTVTWDMGDLAASSGCTYQTVVVRYPNPPFTVAQNVVNMVDGTGTIVGGIPWTDTASVTNPLAQLVPNPTVSMNKSPGRSGYIIGSRAQFLLSPKNTGNVALDGFTVTDTLPAQINLTQITIGSFDNYAGSIIVRYERSDNPGVWNVWPGGPFPADNRALDVSALSLPGGVYITKVQWDYGTVIPGFAPSGGGAGRIQLYGTVISPDHNGNTVTVGSVITNTAVLDWHYTPSTGGPGIGGNSTGSASIDVDAIPNPVFDKTSGGGVSAAWRFLIGQQVGYYSLTFNNNTGISVDNFTITDPVPAQYNVTSITVGNYDNFTGTVTIRYQRSDNPGVWNVWGSPFTPTNQILNVSALGLPGGVYVTDLEWGYGTVGVDFRSRAGQEPRINGVVINPDHNGNAVNDGDTMSNTAQMDWIYQGVLSQQPDTQNDIVRKPVANPSVQKSTTTSGPYIPTSIVTYALRVGAAGNSPSVLINPIVMELLPANLNYVAGSWVYNAGGTGVAAPGFEQIANYNGTGRTLLRWRFTGNFPQNQFATISFNTTITAGSSQGSLTNDYYVTSNDVDINGTTTDVNDLDGDGQTADQLIGASTTIPVDQLVGLDSFKGVRGELDSGYSVYPASGLTIPSGRVDYRLTIINRGNIPVNNVKVIDILPFIGDTGVQDTRQRNSAWRPLLTGAVAAPAGVTVYYSTASNPCRPQIIPSGPAGCTAPNWSLLPPADITMVYSLRFDFSGNLAPGQSFVFNWTMKAPPDAVDGSIAWNSFAYTSTNASTGVPLRPAEPNKVGIKMSRPVVAPLIDLVKSTNGDDANLPTGPLIQVGDPVTWLYRITNTGNTRLANITLTDDILGTITCNEGPIPALDPADFFDCTVNGVATLGQYVNTGTVSGQPVDSSDVPLVDINSNPLPPVTDTDPSHYYGFTPALARLGDFVWIDSNSNGVQDSGEPGLGGVTVNLYQNSSPATIFATTFTDGTGFYDFLNLAPDDYFVEFVIPSTYTFTAQDQGGDDTKDSDADTTTGRTAVTTLISGENDPTWDAGVLPVASIGDFVWHDNNGNNVQNSGEAGVAGVQVDLLNSVGTVIATTFTDPAGYYVFADLVPGDYALHFTLPTGYLFSLQDQGGNDAADSDVDIITGKTINTTLSPGENDPTWDAGLVQVSSIGDRVWRDNNNNGQQDSGEPGVSGITVRLLDSVGTVLATTTTDVNGNYLFNNLRNGDYAIEVVLPTGFVFSAQDVGNNNSDSDVDTTTGRTINVTLPPAKNDLTWDAGLVPLASIGDRVWNDQNNNGQQDSGEPGFPGVTVNLLNSTGTVIATTTTDGSGNYLFDNLRPADYAIEVVKPFGYVYSPLDVGADASDSDVNRTTGHTINTTLSPGENDLTWDAGLVQDASIGDFVWSDTNDNGIQDGGEPGVSGITVHLLDNLGNVVSTTTTDGSGNYLFDFLTPADYAIEFIAPTGYSLARRDQGGNDAADSDPNRFSGKTINTTLSPGEDDLTWDAGLVLSASIGDFVWIDTNQNGLQDGGELGLNNVTVRLLDSTNTVVLTTTTNASGAYLFDPVPPDDYRVEVVLPAGYVFTLADQGADTIDSDVDITTGRTILTTLLPDQHDMTWDAGVIPVASIGDFVWRDNNNNGVQDGGEPGVSGVTVQLRDSGGALVSTTTTNGSGNYSFNNLRPGDYSIQVVLPTGYQFSQQDAAAATDSTDSDVDITTGKAITTTLDPGENDPTWDAGLVPLANIGDFVWRDNNNNGRQDGGEPGVNNVSVHLLDSSGTQIASTTTNASGAYAFTNLPPGTYAIEFVLPSGYQFSAKNAAIATTATDSDADMTTGRTINTLLDPGETDNTWDGGLVPLANIGNFVWQDTNGNGQQDGGEPGINNVTVHLLNSSGTQIGSTTTNASGIYSFTNLPPGTYAVEFVLPGGYIFTARDLGSNNSDSDPDRTTGRTINTTLSPGQTDNTWDAGMVLPASLGDYVWLDANDNGGQDGGESAVPNVTVRLLNTSFTVLATTTTDSSGNYLFDNLIPGNYIVEFVPPAGDVIARLDQGGNDATDSDANRTTGRTITKALAMGENDMSWDAGLVQVASIGDRVWIDSNNNGVQDGGEVGLANVTVQLRDSGGTLVTSTTTDGSGNYLFSNLTPADYSIQVVLPTGYQFSPQNAAAATASTDSDVNTGTGRTVNTTLGSGENDLTWDAGLVPLASIGDFVWRDINNNGVQDSGELNISGVTVRLLNSGGTIINTTTTNASGAYSFTNLPPATYAIQVVLPVGYQFSPQDAAAATDLTDSDVDTTTGKTINTLLDPGEADLTWDAGLVPQTTIGDRVWIDTNDNGVQDGGEVGLASVTVNLLNSSGTVINTTTTNGTGNYSFTNLPPGTYAIEFVPPAGYVISKLDQGGDDTQDSDADLTTGHTINTLLDPSEVDMTWDMGLVPVASIGDLVWQDANGNGQQDGGEPGVNNVTVHLLDSGGTVIQSTTTNASGNYLFANLRPGTYAIEFVLPSGYIYTTRDVGADASDSDPDRTTGRTISTVLSPGENDLTWDAGIVQPATLGDFVWLDNNDNGVQDGGESGVSGVTVNLLNGSGTVIGTTTTDSNGKYLFDNLIPGTYAVEFVPPAGDVIARQDGAAATDLTDSDADRTTGRTITTTLTPGEDDPTWDAGLVQVASIGDLVWLDNNNNGIQDGVGEPGVSGVTVNLLNSAGVIIATTTTDGSGNYLFNNLTPADYAIQVVLPAGYQFSPQDAVVATDLTDSDVNTTTGKTINTTLGSGENDPTWDAGLVPLASIGDRIWIDINNNGVQDGSEVGLVNVTVQLRDSGGALVTSMLTNATGNYLFNNLPPADYSIQVVLPAGYQFSLQDAAAATDLTDSDVNTTTGKTINTTLIPGENDPTWDAGVVPLTSIGDRVWIDINDNGTQDLGELNLANVTVNLLDSSGTIVGTTTTNGTGNYLFSNLAPADYAIQFVAPAGYVIAKLDQGGDDALDSDANLTTGRTINTLLDPGENDLTWDAGMVPVASIGDFVWRDMNNNGVQDGGETGLSGVTVNLLDSSGTVIATKTTDSNGNYLFDNLRPGVYAVEVALPAGYQFSPPDAAVATDLTDSDANITTGRMINTTLDPAENDLTWDAGVVPLASIGDFVWRDMNNNGVQDGGEIGLSGVTVRLLDSGGTVIATTTTDGSGNYAFTLLPPGTYGIQVVLPTGYQFSPQDAAAATDSTDSDVNITTGKTVNTTLTPGQNDLTWDAGVVPLTSIGNTVWRDNNGDGVQDAGEPGVSGVTVRLLDSAGTVIGTTVTDASGKYSFTNLPPADYAIQIVLPTGYIFSPQDAAAATDLTDSDVNTTTGKTINTTLSPSENDLTWDAGLIPLGSIGDTVWIDLNGDAIVDAGETGIPNVKLNLLDSLGNVITMTTTDANGNYLFKNLIAGTYTVEVDITTLPPKYGLAYDPDSVKDSQSTYKLAIGENVLTLDFGYWPLGSIGDTVWLDANHNGVQDIVELGIPNVTLTLSDSTGTVIATMMTDANGNYLFDNLPPGTYTVEVDLTTLPPGLIATYDLDGGLDSTTTVTIGPGEDLLTVDFGYAPPIPPVAGSSATATLVPTPEITPTSQPGQPWTPVTACQTKCVNWQLYHTNETGDWEIFRLGNLDDRPAVSPNLSQGAGADDIAPTRSPNAEWIVFSSNRDGNWELYVAPTDGDSSKTRRITHNTFAIDTDPVWGPNNYVAFETTRDGNWELYLLDMTTGVETRLTDNPANDINAFWSPDGTKLLFQSDRSGKWQIYEIDLRTGSISGLSDGIANDVDPQYNNAGDKIVFRSYRDGDGQNSVIYTMDADGRNIQRVSDVKGDATSQSWSPDDSLIAYQSNLDGDLDIYVYDTRSGKTRKMTDNTVADYAPTWLCGTTQLIFTSDVSGNPDLFNAETLPIDAPAIKVETDAKQLTVDTAADIYPENSPTEENASLEGRLPGLIPALGDQTDFLQPDFSVTAPDVSTESPEDWHSINSCQTVCPSWSLYHSDRTGDGEIFRLDDQSTDANSLDVSLGAGANDFGPTRAPNAQWIAFTSNRDGNNEIYIAASDGSVQYRATNNPANDTDPAWSPDSQHIVYESDRDGNWNLYMVDVQTGVEKRLTDDPGDDRNASWSSAGGKIAFESNRSGTWQIYVYDLGTGKTTQLTSSDQNARSPVYGNGGSLIAYTLEQADGKLVIEIMQEDGTKVQPISDPTGDAQNPSWYFDDTLLAYQSNLDGDLDIYVYDFASSQTRKLTNNNVDDYAPTWQCGKPAVTFTSDVTGNPDLFRTDALPIDRAPVDLQTDAAQQLTQNPSADSDPVGAPTEENASREAE
ncbi:MAG: SdrD B-like domain-containing protein [Chloroflexota bacterium]